jgi:hypothetical protein
MLVSNIDWSDYVGRDRHRQGHRRQVTTGDTIWRIGKDGKKERAK